MINLPATQAKQTPISLADEINHEHQMVVAAFTSSLQHAKRAGELLSQAKSLCGHGEWLEWIDEHFDGSRRTAQAYMQVAEKWPTIELNAQRDAHLSLREALRLTAEPKPEVAKSVQGSGGQCNNATPEQSNDDDFTPIKDFNKSEKYAVECARCAITQLERIPAKNPGRDQALTKVMKWIEKQLQVEGDQ